MPTALITGANRGIGFQHAKQYAEQGWTVHACARNPAAAEALQELAGSYAAKVHVHALEVTDHAAVASAFGVRSWTVDDPTQLEEVLKQALAHDGPTLIDVISQPLHEAAAPVSEWVA